jgi:hypothetical protein
MKLPESTFDVDDEETCAVVRLIYHKRFYTPESEMTRARLPDVWHEVRFDDYDPQAMRSVADRITDQFICDYRYMGRRGYPGFMRLAFKTRSLYFRSSKDATMAKLTLHPM